MHLGILSTNDLFMVHYISWICDKCNYFWNIKKWRNESTFLFGILRQWWNQFLEPKLILESFPILYSPRSQNRDFDIFTSIFRIRNMKFGFNLRSFTIEHDGQIIHSRFSFEMNCFFPLISILNESKVNVKHAISLISTILKFIEYFEHSD